MLLAERERTAALIESLSSRLAAVLEATSDAAADDEHDPEGVTLSSEWSRLSGLAEAAQAELRQVDEALMRMDAGTYGICAHCGRPIPPERLEVRPFAEYCVACAEKLGR